MHLFACVYEGLCLCVAQQPHTLPTPMSGTLFLASMPELCQALGAGASTWLPGPMLRTVGTAHDRGGPCFLWASGPCPMLHPCLFWVLGGHGPSLPSFPFSILGVQALCQGFKAMALSKLSLPPRCGPLVSQGNLRDRAGSRPT